jgi:DNA primase
MTNWRIGASCGAKVPPDLVSRNETDSPTRYFINMSKAKRTGNIFLDYLWNDRFSAAVAPLSPFEGLGGLLRG